METHRLLGRSTRRFVAKGGQRADNGDGNPFDSTTMALFVRDASDPSCGPDSGDRVALEPTVDAVFIDELRVIGKAANQDFLGELVAEFVEDTDTLLVELRDA